MEGRGLVLAKEDDADCRLSLTRQSRGTFVYIIIPTEFGEFCVTFLFLSSFYHLARFFTSSPWRRNCSSRCRRRHRCRRPSHRRRRSSTCCCWSRCCLAEASWPDRRDLRWRRRLRRLLQPRRPRSTWRPSSAAGRRTCACASPAWKGPRRASRRSDTGRRPCPSGRVSSCGGSAWSSGRKRSCTARICTAFRRCANVCAPSGWSSSWRLCRSIRRCRCGGFLSSSKKRGDRRHLPCCHQTGSGDPIGSLRGRLAAAHRTMRTCPICGAPIRRGSMAPSSCQSWGSWTGCCRHRNRRRPIWPCGPAGRDPLRPWSQLVREGKSHDRATREVLGATIRRRRGNRGRRALLRAGGAGSPSPISNVWSRARTRWLANRGRVAIQEPDPSIRWLASSDSCGRRGSAASSPWIRSVRPQFCFRRSPWDLRSWPAILCRPGQLRDAGDWSLDCPSAPRPPSWGCGGGGGDCASCAEREADAAGWDSACR